jgi:tRNA threonylcarbamoyladenosine modification (KEOPS) complex  Pcc1 subunit
MKPNCNATIECIFDSQKDAKNVFLALQPELNNTHEKRSKIKMQTNKKLLVMNVIAEDLTALKASVNSYCKLIWIAAKLFKNTKVIHK